MATGDTHGGQVRVMREDTEGNRVLVAGPFRQSRIDYFNNDVDSVEELYLNTAMSARVAKPANAESRQAPNATFYAGEQMLVQHQADATVTNDIDVSASAFGISVLKEDKNRGTKTNPTLTVADNEESSDPSEATDSWVTFFSYTVPDRTEVRLAGSFEAVAVEN